MNVASPHEISQVNYLNFNANTPVECDPWQIYHILMLDVCFLSEYPQVALNSLRNASKLLSKGDLCSNKDVNQTRVVLNNKVPMSSIRVGLVGYRWGWSWMAKRTWLTKLRNFECVPSNLSSRLIYDSFG
jgi:hypothetical protein